MNHLHIKMNLLYLVYVNIIRKSDIVDFVVRCPCQYDNLFMLLIYYSKLTAAMAIFIGDSNSLL